MRSLASIMQNTLSSRHEEDSEGSEAEATSTLDHGSKPAPSLQEQEREAREDGLFLHALHNMDVIFAHQATATLLSTRLPAGVHAGKKSYETSGWCAFERMEAQLLKPFTLCIDIGLFTVDAACGRFSDDDGQDFVPLRIGEARFEERSVTQLAKQGSFVSSGQQGVLSRVVGGGRRAPFAPEAFEHLMRTQCSFTNPADFDVVVELYQTTATILLGSTLDLEFHKLEWEPADFSRLGEALSYCGMLERLSLRSMGLTDLGAAAVVAGLAACPALNVLILEETAASQITVLPDVARLVMLRELDLCGCSSLRALDVSKLQLLRVLNLSGCSSLEALPDVSKLRLLRTFDKPFHSLCDAGDGRDAPAEDKMKVVTIVPRATESAAQAQLEGGGKPDAQAARNIHEAIATDGRGGRQAKKAHLRFEDRRHVSIPRVPSSDQLKVCGQSL